MPITIGTGKSKLMNKTVVLISAFLILSACGKSPQAEEVALIPKSNVEITNVHKGSISNDLQLFATTVYLKRNSISSPIPAYITKVTIRLGDRVSKGDLLYELESKEKRALGNQLAKIDSSLKGSGIIEVRAQASGIVTTLDKQQTGDYVLEGTQLCTIAESSDLAFQVNVPYEFIHFTKRGKSCRIILPDNSVYPGLISTHLSSMNIMAQTQLVIAKVNEPLVLPENLIVKVLVNRGDDTQKQVVPLTCVQSDEMMQSFWVMKLINDSTAVKVPVVLGLKNEEAVEIIRPEFDPSDRIVLTGSYGLPDTALVQIISRREHGN